jgi:predicted regulator of Ras-like GTPase activity (Roadblock/LC7/MglB family)
MLEQTLEKLVKQANGCLAAAVVNLNTGQLLGAYHSTPYFTRSFMDAVGALAVDMFRGKTMTTVEMMLSAQRGSEIKHSVREIQMTTAGTFHFMTVIPGKPDFLLIVVTRATVSRGSGWMTTRHALKEIADKCP